MAGIRKPVKPIKAKETLGIIARLKQRLTHSQTERSKYKKQLAKVRQELREEKKAA